MLELASAQASLAPKRKRSLLNGGKGLRRVSWHCSCIPYNPNPVYLQAGDGQAASVVRQRGDGHRERRVWDVLLVKFDGNLIVTWDRCTR